MMEERRMEQQVKSRFYSNLLKGILILSTLLFTMGMTMKLMEQKSIASTSQVGVITNYIDETITVIAGNSGSSKFYISKNQGKSWDLIDPNGPIDMSAYLSSKAVELQFKGNKDTSPVTVMLQPLETALLAEYMVVNGEGMILLSGTSLPIEYRNGKDGQWKQVSNSLMKTSPYEMNGATLDFRTMATLTSRAGKIVNVKITKKATAPAVKLDGSKLNISGLKVGETQYRVGDSTTWIDFAPSDTKVKTLDLRVLLAPTLPENTPIPAGIIEFRKKATDKKMASAVKVIEVPTQRIAPENVLVTGTTVSAIDNNGKTKYEYAVLPNNTQLNLNTLKWTGFTSSKAVVAKNAKLGDRILVRLKSETDSKTKNVIPASTYKSFIVTMLTY